MVGDGESETGPLATSWHSTKFLNPITDGAVLPVLHLNGYKINNPTILARVTHDELKALFIGYGWTPYFVEGSDPESMHQAFAATLEKAVLEIRGYQKKARESGKAFRPRWPMIVLRSPKGWTGPRTVDGRYLEGYWRSHQVPIPDVAANPDKLKILEDWMKSYTPDKYFGADGKLIPELKALAPEGNKRLSAAPVANGGLIKKPLHLKDFRGYAIDVKKGGITDGPSMANMARYLRDVIEKNPTNFRLFGPDETESNKLGEVYKASKKVWLGEYFEEDADGGNLALEGRVMEMLSEHTVEGWLEGYILQEDTACSTATNLSSTLLTRWLTSTASGSKRLWKSSGVRRSLLSTSFSLPLSGDKTTMALRIKIRVSSTLSPTNHPKLFASTSP